MQRQGDDTSRADFFARFEDALAVDPEVACLDHRLRERAAFCEADTVEKAVDPQQSAPSSAA